MKAVKYKTEQEQFWAGDFGTEYIQRNQGDKLLASNLNFFSKALSRATGVKSIIEFGANIGMNLKALKLLHPDLDLHAIEINPQAANLLAEVIPSEHVHQKSILDFHSDRQWDLAMIKGVLIHINPEELGSVYTRLASASNRYVLIAEYYNPAPVAIPYRGHSDRLFKRDFAGEFMDKHPEFGLIDYGFAYRRDPNFPQDDITWFLLEKK